MHLWDACTGELRCSYCAYDDKDAPTAATSLAFNPSGTRLVTGVEALVTYVTYGKGASGLDSLSTAWPVAPCRAWCRARGWRAP